MTLKSLFSYSWTHYKANYVQLSYPFLILVILYSPLLFLVGTNQIETFISQNFATYFMISCLNTILMFFINVFCLKNSFYCLTNKPIGKFGIFNFSNSLKFLKIGLFITLKIGLGIFLLLIPGFLWSRKLIFAPIISLIEGNDSNAISTSEKIYTHNKSLLTKFILLLILSWLLMNIPGIIFQLITNKTLLIPFIIFLTLLSSALYSFVCLFIVSTYVKLKEACPKESLSAPIPKQLKEPSWLKIIGTAILFFITAISIIILFATAYYFLLPKP